MAWVGSMKLVISGQKIKLTVSGITIQTSKGTLTFLYITVRVLIAVVWFHCTMPVHMATLK